MSHGFTIRLMDRDCLYNYQSRRFPTNGISTGIRLLIFMPTWNCSKHAFQFSPMPWSEITCPFTKHTLVIYYEGLEFSSAGYSNEDENIYLRNDFRPPQDWHAISRICGSAQTWRILFLPLVSIPEAWSPMDLLWWFVCQCFIAYGSGGSAIQVLWQLLSVVEWKSVRFEEVKVNVQ